MDQIFHLLMKLSTGLNHFGQARDVKMTPVRCAHARSKYCDSCIASNTQYLFTMLDFTEKSAVESTIHFTQRKQFQREITAEQLRDKVYVSKMKTDDQMIPFFKKIRSIPQSWKPVTLDLLGKIKDFQCVCSFPAQNFIGLKLFKFVHEVLTKI